MKSLFLSLRGEERRSNPNNKLILFFNGWSLDENMVKHLASVESDVLMFFDYADLEISQETLDKINSYQEINVIAWSFGVWACSKVINNFNNLNNIVTINGTPIPIDNRYGIPEGLFNLTLANLSEKTYTLFFKNMFKDRKDMDITKLPNRTIENQRNELIQIKKLSSENNIPKDVILDSALNFSPTKIIVSVNDRIVSPKNQINFWSLKNNAPLVEIDEGHCVLNLFNKWEDILDYA